MDNTTVFGARRAYEREPPPGRNEPSGVDLRSLMDVLEAVVLFDEFGVDCSSRGGPAWADLSALSLIAGSFYHDSAMIPSELRGALVRASTLRIAHLLETGTLVEQIRLLPESQNTTILPPQYLDSLDFVRCAMEGVEKGDPHRAAVRDELTALVQALGHFDPAVQNFAFFAFRGFYYQQAAHATSRSYSPHSWRSALIGDGIGAPGRRFADYAIGVTADLRRQLTDPINAEFGERTLSADFPVIASYVVSQCASRDDLLRTAVEIRRGRKATVFRSWLSALEEKIRYQEDLPAIRQAQEELKELVHELRDEFGLGERGERQEITLKVGLPIVSAETVAHVPRPHSRHWSVHRRTHLVFLRELARESARLAPFTLAFQRLGP